MRKNPDKRPWFERIFIRDPRKGVLLSGIPLTDPIYVGVMVMVAVVAAIAMIFAPLSPPCCGIFSSATPTPIVNVGPTPHP